MKDPVTATTGITYDRQSIEYWLLTAEDAACPVTKQPLPRDSDLTPNHTLRRLIQAWCMENANRGIDRIPTPKPLLSISHVLKLIRDLKFPQLYINSLRMMDVLANESDKNRKCMVDAGAAKAMVLLVIKCHEEARTTGLEEALRILHLTWTPTPENKQLVKGNSEFIESILWVLRNELLDERVAVKTLAMQVLQEITEVASSSLLERLKFDFFKQIVNFLRENISQQATKSVLKVLIEVCPWGRNRMKIVEAGAVFELIELELTDLGQNMTELIICLLAQLCSCADGRAQLLKHAGGIALLTKRTLRVSPATDDQTIQIFSLVAKFSATQDVLLEMLRVGAVAKLCMVVQADSAAYLKKKAREILRLHSNVWNNSPCITVYLLTRDTR
ncbi:hypothetical protein RJ640_000388 [Escallonia rubra]|uniref:U-box domain-containing protein n=1 Tax=Escallonia rubra TaxID=112253 RepID=A0AA88UQQ9_9ASTE|nr:hypothetical protein RJ640_004029 [Escallonia rubra]KAK2989863.1 hypothetical protein RJ640_000388 [Escallonia rubra]